MIEDPIVVAIKRALLEKVIRDHNLKGTDEDISRFVKFLEEFISEIVKRNDDQGS